MKTVQIFFYFFCCAGISCAQFAPPAGQPGSSAIYKDSSIIAGWATQCTVVRGYQDISNSQNGYASVGDSSDAIGAAGGSIVSLGDGGHAVLQFASSIKDGPGYDFAVFENSFSDDYLELAFVEVSSDGINFVRFPATSLTQDTVQVSSFGLLDATKLNNLAGKYRMNYGTPFDLSELSGAPGLDINNITHVRIIDAIGNIDQAFATSDQYGNFVNDPWPTAFPSSGFDLDAIAVINQNPVGFTDISKPVSSFLYSWQDDVLSVSGKISGTTDMQFQVLDVNGKLIHSCGGRFSAGEINLNFTLVVPDGIYFINCLTPGERKTKKIIVHE